MAVLTSKQNRHGPKWMAARRILPKLTLYTGTGCSLCDISKEALGKVQVRRPFELTTINIHSPGNEIWKKKYIHWIPALHLEGTEIAKGRWGESEVEKALMSWETQQQQQRQQQKDNSESGGNSSS